jgi:hypothetical protein
MHIVSIETTVKQSKSSVVVSGPKNSGCNSMISSDRGIVASAEASRFKSEERGLALVGTSENLERPVLAQLRSEAA